MRERSQEDRGEQRPEEPLEGVRLAPAEGRDGAPAVEGDGGGPRDAEAPQQAVPVEDRGGQARREEGEQGRGQDDRGSRDVQGTARARGADGESKVGASSARRLDACEE